MSAVAGVVINVKVDILQDELRLSGLVDHAEHSEGGPRNEHLEPRLYSLLLLCVLHDLADQKSDSWLMQGYRGHQVRKVSIEIFRKERQQHTYCGTNSFDSNFLLNSSSVSSARAALHCSVSTSCWMFSSLHLWSARNCFMCVILETTWQ